MKFSFVIPSFKTTDNLLTSLNSILASIENRDPKKRFNDVEIIVLLNEKDEFDPAENKLLATTNYFHTTIKSLRYTKKDNISKRKNLAANVSNGEYLIFLEGNVALPENWLADLEEFITSRSPEIVGFKAVRTIKSEKINKHFKNFLTTNNLKTKQRIDGDYMMVSRDLFLSMEGFDESLRSGVDADFLNRADRLYAFRLIKQTTHLQVINQAESFLKTAPENIAAEKTPCNTRILYPVSVELPN